MGWFSNSNDKKRAALKEKTSIIEDDTEEATEEEEEEEEETDEITWERAVDEEDLNYIALSSDKIWASFNDGDIDTVDDIGLVLDMLISRGYVFVCNSNSSGSLWKKNGGKTR